MTTRDWAQRNIDAGYQVVPLRPRTKEPYADGWLKIKFQPEDFEPNDNLGIRSVDGLVAIDLDSTEAVAVADDFLPPTEMVYGRPSKLRSKRWYRSTFSKTVPFKLDNRMVVEIRAEHQDMAPPSVHPSGERLEWVTNGAPAEVEPEALLRSCRLITTTTLVARNYAESGARHFWMLELAGLFRNLGLSHDEANAVVEAAARLSGAPNLDDRLLEVRTTYQLQEGWKALTKPKAFVDAVKKIWREESPIVGPDTILVEGGKLDEIVRRIEAKLLDSEFPIYQRDKRLVMPVRYERPQDLNVNGVKRQLGSLALSSLKEAKLIRLMGTVSRWQSGHRPVDAPPIYARTLLAQDEWPFPSLRAIVNAPTLRRDGSVLDTPGYDAQTRLLVDFDPATFPPIPAAPTHDDAHAALEQLAHPLRGFPFVDDAAKATALATMMTALVRPVMRTAPMFAFDAPTPGTGKSKLAEISGLLATGVHPPAMNQGKTAEEDEKRLSTVLMAGDSIIHIDNCRWEIQGDFLCTMLTQPVVQARILGQSERREMESAALVMASGNNLTFAGDTSRRAVICRLDTGSEHPEWREFDFDCHAEVLGNRPQLVVAALTALRAYVLAGRPVKLKPMDFPDFDWIRGTLVWLGYADPEQTRQSIFENDPRRDEFGDVMNLWQMALGNRWVEVAEIEKLAGFTTDHAQMMARPPIIELRDKLIEVAQSRVWNGRSVGWWLRRHKDRVLNNRVFRSADSANGKRWKLDANAAEPNLVGVEAEEGL